MQRVLGGGVRYREGVRMKLGHNRVMKLVRMHVKLVCIDASVNRGHVARRHSLAQPTIWETDLLPQLNTKPDPKSRVRP
jgi:hypothetical protein